MGAPNGIDVDPAALDRIASDLSSGSTGLTNLAPRVPRNVDAGLMTATISALLGQVTNSAGEVATALTAASENVGVAANYYRRTDADASASFAEMRQVVEGR